jgi:hypothetical protein
VGWSRQMVVDLERSYNKGMGKNIDIGALGERVGSEFEYREFASDTLPSSEQQRWKLLEGVAKHAPGAVLKSVDRPRQSPLPPIQVQERQDLAPLAARPSQEAITQYSRYDIPNQAPLDNRAERRSFSHLFGVYTNDEAEQKPGNKDKTSLKALLRKINS